MATRGVQYASFVIALFALPIGALPSPQVTEPKLEDPLTTHYRDLSVELDRTITGAKSDLRGLMKKALRSELAPKEGPETLLRLDNPHNRSELKVFIDAAIKMKIQQLEHLDRQKNYLSGEYKIGTALLGKETPSEVGVDTIFRCANLPLVGSAAVVNTFQKSFVFGQPLNPSLGASSSKSQGIWWANTFGTFVQACEGGEVILSEFVEGRGHVVGIKHNPQFITLYGNLDPATVKTVRVGMKVPRGVLLGIALDRFYFEARRNGEAVNPERIFEPAVQGQETDAATLHASAPAIKSAIQ